VSVLWHTRQPWHAWQDNLIDLELDMKSKPGDVAVGMIRNYWFCLMPHKLDLTAALSYMRPVLYVVYYLVLGNVVQRHQTHVT
jgi:hypothetical protein